MFWIRTVSGIGGGFLCLYHPDLDDSWILKMYPTTNALVIN